MKNFKKRYGNKISSCVLILMAIMVIYPFMYWLPRPELTFIKVALKFWYFLPAWAALFIVSYVFDSSNDIHV